MAAENEKTMQGEDLKKVSGGTEEHFSGYKPLTDTNASYACPKCRSSNLEYREDNAWLWIKDMQKVHCLSCGHMCNRMDCCNGYDYDW